MRESFVIGQYDWLKTQGGRPTGERRYAILRVGKIKTKGQLGAALSHNFRERHTPNADLDLLHENTVLKGPENGQDVIAAWEARAPEKIRKNAVHALEYFVGASPEKMAAMSRTQQDAYFRKALGWFEDRHGKDNVLSAVIHRDETTPHMQILVIPLDARGRLNARELVGGKATLSRMQTDFAHEVGISFGLERGRERSQATHQTIKEYYARAQEPVEADFRLPERRKGNVLGVGRESDEEWRQRATEAAREALLRTKAQYEDRLRQIERGAAQLLSGIRNHEKALRRELGLSTAEERQMADIRMNGFLITARTRELSPTESRDLLEAVETVFGPDGMKRLLEGDLDQLPGETFAHRVQAAAPILHALVDAGKDVTLAVDRAQSHLHSIQEAKAAEEEEKRVRARTIVIERTHTRGHDKDDVWEL